MLLENIGTVMKKQDEIRSGMEMKPKIAADSIGKSQTGPEL